MLSTFDDYPIHQTPQPLAHPASTDRNVYDRYWANGFTADGALYFGVALGLYPNRSVMDCAFSVVVDGVQRSFFASRRAPVERGELRVGPLRIEIVEPMRVLRVTLAENDTSLACDLTFSARTAPVEEERQVLQREGRVMMDVTRFTQFGRWTGTIRCGGHTLAVDAATTYATRDRSWGIRPVGEPDAGAPPRARPQLFFLWAPLHWADSCSHACLFEDAGGRQLHAEAKLIKSYPSLVEVPAADDAGIQRLAGIAHRIDYQAGTRRARSGAITMLDATGATHTIEFEPIMRFQMKGLGYRHPKWSHGVWQGELATGGDEWEVAALDPLAIENIHVQQLVRARMDGRTGTGTVEQLIVGPHAPSGFTGLADGAR